LTSLYVPFYHLSSLLTEFVNHRDLYHPLPGGSSLMHRNLGRPLLQPEDPYLQESLALREKRRRRKMMMMRISDRHLRRATGRSGRQTARQTTRTITGRTERMMMTAGLRMMEMRRWTGRRSRMRSYSKITPKLARRILRKDMSDSSSGRLSTSSGSLRSADSYRLTRL